ncbi:sensor histidine kinase [Robertkochia flava]|uniref:sensor histidine kinase n=1 Tax=Robertkochia flava TaxID=3447986 RepID=UPI001CCB9909|nr:HAMP domain-containing sensor histidine kinase [Robertkochia marina]
MKLRNILITLFVLAVLGLIYVQYQYLRIGLNLAAVQFNEKMGAVVTDVKDGLVSENKLSFLVGKAVAQDDTYFNLSIDSVQDASRYFLDDYLKEVLVKHGINSAYTYVLRNRDTVEYLHSPRGSGGFEKPLSFPVKLEGYLPQVTGENLVLELQFQNLNSYFLSQLRGLTIPGLVFILIIIGVTVWVLKGFLRQQSLISITNEFINNLTHELKTPVFSIGLATKLLAESEQVNKKEVAEIIRVQLEKLKGQIDRVLELASLEEKGEVLQKTKFNLQEMVTEVGAEFESVARLEGIHFEMDISEQEVDLKGIRGHLKNAVDTLLDNARKYSEDPRKVKLVYRCNGKTAWIRVEDNGIGIAEADQKRIFNKFYRIGSGDLHLVKGYGLGLHYVKHIVKLHDGKVSVESQPGSGSVFTIQLPLK